MGLSPLTPAARRPTATTRTGGDPARCPLPVPVALFLARFSNKSKRPEYCSLGTKQRAAIIHSCVPSFLVNISPFHKLIKVLFPETETRALGPGWAQSVSFGARNHQLLLRPGSGGLRPVWEGGGQLGGRSTSGKEGCRWPWLRSRPVTTLLGCQSIRPAWFQTGSHRDWDVSTAAPLCSHSPTGEAPDSRAIHCLS